MENKSLAVMAIVAIAVMLVTSLAGTNSAFAGGYEKSQATAQINYCGNGELPLNVGCQNAASQMQGDDNSVAGASTQVFDD
jgi:hypothetical protein